MVHVSLGLTDLSAAHQGVIQNILPSRGRQEDEILHYSLFIVASFALTRQFFGGGGGGGSIQYWSIRKDELKYTKAFLK